MDTMSVGAIIVSMLYKSFNPQEIDLPYEILEYESSKFSMQDQSILLKKTMIAWNDIELHFHLIDNKIRYTKDHDAANAFYHYLGHYYATYYNMQIRLFNSILLDCRKESMETKWTDSLIHMYSSYYLMRHTLVAHIKYLCEINPRLIGLQGKEITVDTLLEDPGFQKKEELPMHSPMDYLLFTLWKLI